MTASATGELQRVCAKYYVTDGAHVDDQVLVAVFHDWIRNRVLDRVLLDVADYAHVPDGPGMMLVAHEESYGLDRADGRLGLLVQRRRPVEGGAVAAISTAMRNGLEVMTRLEAEPRVNVGFRFDRRIVRIESNDRLRAPNTDDGHAVFAPMVRAAAEDAFPGRVEAVTRVPNDPRDRLAIEVRIAPV